VGLVGAATLPKDSVKALLADSDTRWINRGAYDLLGVDPSAKQSAAGLPRACALYGSLPDQLKNPQSFASQLKRMLDVRAEYRVYESEQIAVPRVQAPGLVVMVHRLPDKKGTEVTALNFGVTPITEDVALDAAQPGGAVTDLLAGKPAGKRLSIVLAPREGKALLVP